MKAEEMQDAVQASGDSLASLANSLELLESALYQWPDEVIEDTLDAEGS